eukprot:766778-Hanusia_phi.AAC.4
MHPQLELLSAAAGREEYCSITWNLKDILRRVELLFESEDGLFALIRSVTHLVSESPLLTSFLRSGMMENLFLIQQRAAGHIDADEEVWYTPSCQELALMYFQDLIQKILTRADKMLQTNIARGGYDDSLKTEADNQDMELHEVSTWVKDMKMNRNLQMIRSWVMSAQLPQSRKEQGNSLLPGLITSNNHSGSKCQSIDLNIEHGC